jgi:hypothetical protein
LAEASRLSREIEQIFRAEVKFSGEQVEHLEQLVVALRQELERQLQQVNHLLLKTLLLSSKNDC